MKIAVVGATGMFGQPVTRKLRADGHDVVVLSRDPEHARRIFGSGFEYRRILVDGIPTIEAALDGCDAVHINLSARNSDEAERILWRGNENVARVAAQLGLKRISMLSGNFDPDPNHEWPVRRHFSRGVLAVKACGVPYMIFSCTWFQESLPLFIQNNAAYVIGKQPLFWRWVNTADYTRMLGHAYRVKEAENRHFIVHGPEPLTFGDALELYCSIVHPEISVKQYPIWFVKLFARLRNDQALLDTARAMQKFEIYGETGDPHDTDALLGTPTITISDWANQLVRERTRPH